MEAKIRVYGTAQNRTALGIANAYLRLNPDSTLDDLNQAFPETINNATDSDLFVKVPDSNEVKSDSYFAKEDEIIELKDGTHVMMFSAWAKADFDRIVDKSKGYQIEVAECKPAKSFEKGGFVLEEIKKKKCLWWLWIILLILIVLAILLLRRCNKEVVVAPAPTIEAVVDTVKAEPKINFHEKFVSLRFEKGCFAVDETIKPSLLAMVDVLKINDGLSLKIQGHASKDGGLDFNNRLAQKRAQSVFDFFVAQGIAKERLSSESFGISQPVDESDLGANRRVEFVVVE